MIRSTCSSLVTIISFRFFFNGSFLLFIQDARPKKNATANKAKGAGSESIQRYSNCSIKFMNIENIHIMRESATKLLNLLKKE